MEIIYISGSPCSGKSTLAGQMSKKYGFEHFEFDDYLTPFMKQLAEQGNQLCQKTLNYSMEEMWMRDPKKMCEDETRIYRDMMPLLNQKLNECSFERLVLAEGAGIMPKELKAMNVPRHRVVYIVPTKEFLITKYSQRPWIQYFLAECSDPDTAFHNWMERDACFGRTILEEAKKFDYPAIVVDGTKTVEQVLAVVEETLKMPVLE